MSRNFYRMLLVVGCANAANVLKDYKGNELALNSVYGAMKRNFQQPHSLERSSLYDQAERNTINVNEGEYYDTIPSESNNDWAVAPIYPSGNDLVCQRQREAATHITVADHGSNNHISIASVLKWVLIALAALALPAFIFKLFIIPLKVLLGLKAISLVNSLLLAALLFKAKISQFYGGIFPFPPPNPVIPMSAPSSAAAAASSSSSSSAADSFERDEYVEVVQPGDDIRRLLEYVRKRNKNW